MSTEADVEKIAQTIFEAIVEGPWPGVWGLWGRSLDKPVFRDAARAVILLVKP